MNNNKIVPCIWLSADGGTLAHVIDYYKGIFGNAFQSGGVIPLGQTPSGKGEMCEVTVFEQKYSLLNTEREHQPLNDAVSFILYCEDQEEIDRYWNYFTREGKESQCGWCLDKYGIRWQVIPKNFGQLMNKPNAMQVMMKQKKIVMAEYAG